MTTVFGRKASETVKRIVGAGAKATAGNGAEQARKFSSANTDDILREVNTAKLRAEIDSSMKTNYGMIREEVVSFFLEMIQKR